MIQTAERSTMNGREKILGIEGGETTTGWVLAERNDKELRLLPQGRLPPANFRLETPDRLRAIFRELPREIDRAGIFLAGCGTSEDRQSLLRLCAEIWPNTKIVTGSDRESGLAAALQHRHGIVVSAGNGSSVTGRRGDQIENAGGWGQPLGGHARVFVSFPFVLRLRLRLHSM